MKPKSLPVSRFLPVHIVVPFGMVMAGLSIGTANAADQAWSTAPNNALFSGTNWTSGQTPGAAATTVASTDSLFFGSSSLTSLLNDNTGFTHAGLTFNSGAAAFNLLGNSFTLSGGITNNSSTLQTISTPIALSATQSIDTSAGDVRLNGVISGATFGLTKSTAGTLTLTGANTYTGPNTISGGTVAIGADGNLGATAATVALTGATLKVTPGASITNTHTFTIGGSSTINVISHSIGNFTYIFNTASTLAGSGALTVTGNGSLDVSGLNTGIFVLNAASTASTFTGTLTMQSGGLLELNNNTALPSAVTVALNGNGGLCVNTGVTAMASNIISTNAGNVLNFGNGNAGVVTGNITLNNDLTVGLRDWYNWATGRSGAINGVISGAGGLTAISPGGTLTLGGANTYTGATSLLNCGLTLTANATSTISGSSGLTLCNSTFTASYASGIVDKLKDAGNVSMRNNSFINLTGNASDTTETITGLEIGAGNNTITITTSGTAVTTLAASTLSRSNFGTGLLIGSSLGQQATSVSKISLTTPPSGVDLVGAGGAAAGTGSVKNLGIVPWLAGNPAAAGTAARELVTYDTSLGSLRALVSNEYDSAGTIAGATSGNNVKSATVSETGLTSTTLNALLLAPTADQTIAGDPGNTLTLTSGLLASAMSSGAAGTAAFNSTISGFDAIAFGNNEAIIRTAQTGGNITINSPITVTGGGGLTKTGPGTVTLGAANTYTGPTTICQTALATTVNNVFNGSTGTAIVISNNGQLNVNATTQKITSLTFNGAGNAGGSVIGAGGTLNLGGDITFDTSVTNPNSGHTLSVGTLNLNGNRVFNIGDESVVTGAEMTVSSIIADGSSSSSLTKSGAGTLVLSGANTYGGGTTVNAGILQIGAGGTVGGISGNVVNNGTLTFNRSDALAFGSVSGSGDLFHSGAGTTTLAGSAISTGKIIVRNGTLSVPAVNGSGVIEIGSGATAVGLTYTGTGETTARSLTLTGTTGGVTLTQNGSGLLKFTSDTTVVVNGAKTLTLAGTGSGEISGKLVDSPGGVTSIAKSGTGTWTLSGPSTHTGSFNVSGGTLNLSGSLGNNTSNAQFRVGTVASTPAILNILPGAAASRLNLFVGDAGSGTGGGAVYQSGGSIILTQGAGVDNVRVGSNAGGYGYYKMSGGTLTTNEIGVGASLADTIGVMEVSAGTISDSGWITMGRGSATSSGVLHVTGGTVNASRLDMNWGNNAAALSILNVAGGNVNLTGGGTGLSLANSSTTAGVQGIANLLGGTLTTTIIQAGQAAQTTALNFNGGTLKAHTTNSGATFLTAANIDAVNVYSGGGTIDNNGTSITVGKSLLAPAGFGVSGTSIAVPSGGSGYIGVPMVKFTGGTGTGATGYAVVSGGVVTSITVTSPGTGYTSGDLLTATFFGGGAATAATAVTSIPVAANTSGAMTFQGSGTTTLSGANTYTGTTTVAAGILAVNGSALPDSGKLTITSGKVAATGTEVVDTLYFGATQQASGTWGATGSGATHIDDTRFSGTAGVVSVTSGPSLTGYALWASVNAGNETSDLDFDKDGMENGVEYFMGATGSSFTANPGVVGGAVTWTNGGNIPSGDYGTQFVVQTSTDLAVWTNILITDPNLSNTAGSVTYTLPTGGGKLFVRLKVTPN